MADNNKQLTKRSIKAGLWLSGYRIFARGAGLIKTAVTARLLTPAQFGLFGFVSIALNLFETFTETGIEQALIQKTKVEPVDLITGWWINIFKSLLVAAFLWLMAPFVSQFFEAEVTVFVRVIALTPILRSLRNPVLVLNKKALDFLPETLMLSLGSLVEIVTAVVLALYWQSVWALVISIVMGAASELIASYLLLPQPRWVKPKWLVARPLLNFGKWVWSSSALSYGVNQGDDIVIGRLLDPNLLGIYQNAFRIASLPATEITGTISQVSFPALASIHSDRSRLRRAFGKTLLANIAVTLPLSLGLVIFAEPVVWIIYGSQWLEMVPVLKILALFGLARGYSTNFEAVIVALGQPAAITVSNTLRLILLLSLIGPLTLRYGLAGAAWSTVIAASLSATFLTGCCLFLFLRSYRTSI